MNSLMAEEVARKASALGVTHPALCTPQDGEPLTLICPHSGREFTIELWEKPQGEGQGFGKFRRALELLEGILKAGYPEDGGFLLEADYWNGEGDKPALPALIVEARELVGKP